MDTVVAVTIACMLRECENAGVTVMLVWGTGEVWLRDVSICVVHVVQVLCLLPTT